MTATDEKEATKPGFRSTLRRLGRAKMDEDKIKDAGTQIQDAYRAFNVSLSD